MRQRTLLAWLLLHPNELVRAELLSENLWESGTHTQGLKPLHVAMTRLRNALEPDRGGGVAGSLIVTEPGGYRLHLDPEQLDAARFDLLLETGRRAQAELDFERAAATLGEALELWRGPALADVAHVSALQADIARLEEHRLSAMEERIDAELALGHHRDVVADLERLVADEPLRERLRGQLMIALYRGDRQAHALDVYQQGRRLLAEQLGLEPGQALRDLENAILVHDPALAGVTGAPAPADDQPPPPPWGSGTRLPVQPTELLGREAELESLTATLGRRDVRLLTLTGPAGIGKTRLATRLAHDMSAAFPDAAHFVSLAATAEAADVAGAIAHAFGLVPELDVAAAESLTSYLDARDMLLVLDNFEQVLAASGLVRDILERCARVKIVVTSREPLRLRAEHCRVVAPLAIPPDHEPPTLDLLAESGATALFLERVRAHGLNEPETESERAAVAKICRRLDGLPLAIELAAARTALLGIAELAERLDEALTILGGGPRDAPARQQTLRATLDWSHELLDAGARDVFAQLAVFSGGCDLAAATAVASGDLEALDALIACHLLVRRTAVDGRPRLLMLHTVHQYAREQLAQRADRDACRERHCLHFLHLAEAAEEELHGAAQLPWLRRLDGEINNLRGALQWSLDSGHPDRVIRLVSALDSVWDRHRPSEGRHWLEQALAAGGLELDDATQARALVSIAFTASCDGDFDGASEAAAEALGHAQATTDRKLIARCLLEVSNLANILGRADEAAEAGQAALALGRELGDDWITAMALYSCAVRLAVDASLGEARVLAEESAGLLRALGDLRHVAAMQSDLGYVALVRGEYGEARQHIDEAVQLARELDDPSLLAYALVNRGLTAVAAEDDPSGVPALHETLTICRDHELRAPVPEALLALAAIASRAGDLAAAAELLEAAQGLRRKAPTPPEVALEETVRRGLGARDGDPGGPSGGGLGFQAALTRGLRVTSRPASEHVPVT